MVTAILQAVQLLAEEGTGHLCQSTSATQASHLHAATHVPSVLVVHISVMKSALVTTVEHVVDMATNSLMNLQGMAEQALMAPDSQGMASSA